MAKSGESTATFKFTRNIFGLIAMKVEEQQCRNGACANLFF